MSTSGGPSPTSSSSACAFLDANPRGKHGAHGYTLEDFQLTPDVVKERFAPYIQRFDLNSN